MKKIIVIGCSGSGKSFFTRQLSKKLNIEKYYLDCLYWLPNWEHLNMEDFVSQQKEIIKRDSWIIDGTYSKTLEVRIQACDTIFFFDYDVDVCIEQEKERRGKKREDLPNYLEEKEDPDFILFIQNFKHIQRPIIMDLFQKYPDKKVIVFHTREEKEAFLSTMLESSY